MGLSSGIRIVLASTLVIAPLSGVRSQIYGESEDVVASELDRIVTTDASTWPFSSYRNASMRNGTVLQQSSDGRTQLWRGFFRYGGGSQGEVRVRVRNNRVECLSYDSSWGSWCNLTGGGHNEFAWAVGALVVALVATSGQSRSSPNSGYSDADALYRQCMQRCANTAINEPNIYNARRQQCERNC